MELLPDKEQDSTYTGAFSVEETGLWFYRFEISVPEGLLFVGQGEDAKAKVEDFLPEWQLTVYDPAFSVPEWLKGGILPGLVRARRDVPDLPGSVLQKPQRGAASSAE